MGISPAQIVASHWQEHRSGHTNGGTFRIAKWIFARYQSRPQNRSIEFVAEHDDGQFFYFEINDRELATMERRHHADFILKRFKQELKRREDQEAQLRADWSDFQGRGYW